MFYVVRNLCLSPPKIYMCKKNILVQRSWGSSVSMVCGYRLDHLGSISGRGKGFFSSLCVETIFEAHPATYALGTGDPYPGLKGDRDVRLTTHPLPGPRSRMSRRNASYPPWRLNGGSGTALDYFYVYLNTKCSAENLDLRKRKWQKGR
jgi:hypothetical protein